MIQSAYCLGVLPAPILSSERVVSGQTVSLAVIVFLAAEALIIYLLRRQRP